MILQKLHIIITIITSIIIAITCIYLEYQLVRFAVVMIITIMVSFLVGLIVKKYVEVFGVKRKAEAEGENSEKPFRLKRNDIYENKSEKEHKKENEIENGIEEPNEYDEILDEIQ